MKKKLIFLPGSWANELLFEPQITAFAAGYEIINPPVGLYDRIEKMSDAIVNEHQKAYCVIGLSMGGFIAQDILTRYPHFAEKAILIGTHAEALNDNMKVFIAGLLHQAEQGKIAELCESYAQSVLSPEGQKNAALLAYTQNIPLAVGQTACINHHRACLLHTDKTPYLKNITAKTLILCSAEDAAVPISCHEFLHRHIPNSELVILEKGGHFMTLENPEVVNAHIKDWLES